MKIDLMLDRRSSRMTLIGATTAICGSLLYLAIANFVVGALTDPRIKSNPDSSPLSFITAPFTDDRVGINPDVLASAGHFFPNSSRLHMRLAEVEAHRTDDDWRAADFHARQAIRLSPHDYRPRLILATIREANNDLRGAEESLRTAVSLAPGNLESHWLLGNLLLNTQRLCESFEHFLAAAGDFAYFEAGLQRMWELSVGNIDALSSITPDDPADRLALARFLLQRGRPIESGAVFSNIARQALITDPESGRYLDKLIAGGHVALAHELWCALMDRTDNLEEQSRTLIWNGGFESDILTDFAQFDWTIHASNYARISMDGQAPHSGHRALRIDFIGKETARLDNEIGQLIVVRPGGHYRLRYYVKTQDLVAPQGAQVVSATPSGIWIAASRKLTQGSHDWQEQSIEFVAPESSLVISIKQTPRFSYEDPTYGTVWFDDFEIRELPS